MGYLELIKVVRHNLFPGKYGHFGDYADWDTALQHCSGYDAHIILEKVKQATFKIKNKEAIYERDSVLFDKIEYSWPLLSALMFIAAIRRGKLHVLDFGGSLGSSYFQNRKFLDGLIEVKWHIIEQEAFVKCGRELIQTGELKFFSTVDELINTNEIPDVALISGTLPYIKEPFGLLRDLVDRDFEYLILDNTPFNFKQGNRLTVQKVHPSIYDASYPCWLLDYDEVINIVIKKYDLVSEHTNDLHIYVDGRKINYKGFLAKKRDMA